MNKRISLVLAGAAIGAVALAGCKGSATTAASTSAKAHAVATSSQAREAETAGKDALATCLPKGTVIDKKFLVNLALSKSAQHDLAAKCKIPQANVKPFVKAVAASALNAYFAGSFKTSQGRIEWETKTFSVILKTYQSK